MKKTRYKRILGLLVLTYTILFGGMYSTSAANCSDLETKMADTHYFVSKYKFENVKTDSKGYYVLENSMDDTNVPAGLSKNKIKFKIKALYTYELEAKGEYDQPKAANVLTMDSNANTINSLIRSGNGPTVKAGETLKIERGSILNDGKYGFMIVLEPDGFEDPDLKSCGKSGFVLETGLEMYGTPRNYQINMDDPTTSSLSSSAKIDCSNYTTAFSTDSFEYKFCHAKMQAKNLGKYDYDFGKIDNNSKTYLAFSNKVKDADKPVFACDYTTIFNSQENLDDNSYYQEKNRQYLYGKAEYEYSAGTYYYRYEKRGNNPVTEDATCTIECEESVVVEYGPPVASKAGLCFEYKVKVTSRVSCGLKEGELTVPKKGEYCVPNPICVTAGGSAHNQGGPNEEFDACINTCDKGKYTDKCVDKCYKRIYGKKKSSKKQADEFNSFRVEKLEYKAPTWAKGCDGTTDKKYIYSNGSIIWQNGCTTRSSNEHDAPWHKTNTWGISGHNYSMYHTAGIPKTQVCNDTCSWNGCTGDNIYLNVEQAEADYKANLETYETLKEKCEAAASCSSTTAEFTISVDYKNKNGKQTINFPYTSNNAKNSDKISSQGSEEKESRVNTAGNKNSTILQYAGCYKDESQKRWYQTEWSFPGTWINNKTSEISYKEITSSGWRVKPDKFCIPLDARDVNQKWWLYYYAKTTQNKTTSAKDQNYINNVDACKTSDKTSNATTCNYGTASFTASDAKNIEYNIHASSTKFGYFGWNLEVKCFYALYSAFDGCTNNASNVVDNKGNNSSNSCTTTDGDPYRIRSVDLKNVFPATDGATLTDTSSTGRSPGYNWSKYATQVTKDTDYKSNPENYTTWIQSNGYSVYADENLDYYIYLTKDEINKIKKQNINYTDYKGNVEVNSVTNYRSDLIRSTLGKTYYPNGQALKCNNIGKHSTGPGYSAKCQDFE